MRWVRENELEYLGRIDTQVKIRGFRIELGEIESQLLQLFSLRDAVVLLREEPPGDKRLVAYLVPKDDQFDFSPVDIRTRLATCLPHYMLPSAFVILDKLPLTNNGKVDRKGLPKPQSTIRRREANAVPTTPLERLAAQCWQDLLGIKHVDLHDDFFAIGGHSLLAARVVARINAETGAILAVRDLFDTSNFSRFVTMIADRIASASTFSDDAASHAVFTTSSTDGADGNSLEFDTTIAGESVQTAGLFDIERLNPRAYCDIFSPVVPGSLPIAVVGDRRPVSLLKNDNSLSVPLLHMRLDGVHVSPPLYLTFEQQIEIYSRALEHQLPERRVALIGFSYGATLACRLASALEERGWRQIELMLIEPYVPDLYLPIAKRFREKFKRLLFGARRRYTEFFDDAEGQALDELGDSTAATRWEKMEPFILESAASATWRPLQTRMVLAGCDEYLENFADGCRSICPAGIDICRFEGTRKHSACFEEPYLSQWRSRFRLFN